MLYGLYMHMLAYPKLDLRVFLYVKVSDLINEIEKIIDPRMPLFICGDLNSLPGR